MYTTSLLSAPLAFTPAGISPVENYASGDPRPQVQHLRSLSNSFYCQKSFHSLSINVPRWEMVKCSPMKQTIALSADYPLFLFPIQNILEKNYSGQWNEHSLILTLCCIFATFASADLCNRCVWPALG